MAFWAFLSSFLLLTVSNQAHAQNQNSFIKQYDNVVQLNGIDLKTPMISNTCISYRNHIMLLGSGDIIDSHNNYVVNIAKITCTDSNGKTLWGKAITSNNPDLSETSRSTITAIKPTNNPDKFVIGGVSMDIPTNNPDVESMGESSDSIYPPIFIDMPSFKKVNSMNSHNFVPFLAEIEFTYNSSNDEPTGFNILWFKQYDFNAFLYDIAVYYDLNQELNIIGVGTRLNRIEQNQNLGRVHSSGFIISTKVFSNSLNFLHIDNANAASAPYPFNNRYFSAFYKVEVIEGALLIGGFFGDNVAPRHNLENGAFNYMTIGVVQLNNLISGNPINIDYYGIRNLNIAYGSLIRQPIMAITDFAYSNHPDGGFIVVATGKDNEATGQGLNDYKFTYNLINKSRLFFNPNTSKYELSAYENYYVNILSNEAAFNLLDYDNEVGRSLIKKVDNEFLVFSFRRYNDNGLGNALELVQLNANGILLSSNIFNFMQETRTSATWVHGFYAPVGICLIGNNVYTPLQNRTSYLLKHRNARLDLSKPSELTFNSCVKPLNRGFKIGQFETFNFSSSLSTQNVAISDNFYWYNTRQSDFEYCQFDLLACYPDPIANPQTQVFTNPTITAIKQAVAANPNLTDVYINGNLTVDQNQNNIGNLNFLLAYGSQVVLGQNQNGTMVTEFTFYNCTFKACDTRMWKGIFINGIEPNFSGFYLTLENCSIMQAEEGLFAQHQAKVKIKDCYFAENNVGIKATNGRKSNTTPINPLVEPLVFEGSLVVQGNKNDSNGEIFDSPLLHPHKIWVFDNCLESNPVARYKRAEFGIFFEEVEKFELIGFSNTVHFNGLQTGIYGNRFYDVKISGALFTNLFNIRMFNSLSHSNPNFFDICPSTLQTSAIDLNYGNLPSAPVPGRGNMQNVGEAILLSNDFKNVEHAIKIWNFKTAMVNSNIIRLAHTGVFARNIRNQLDILNNHVFTDPATRINRFSTNFGIRVGSQKNITSTINVIGNRLNYVNEIGIYATNTNNLAVFDNVIKFVKHNHILLTYGGIYITRPQIGILAEGVQNNNTISGNNISMHNPYTDSELINITENLAFRVRGISLKKSTGVNVNNNHVEHMGIGFNVEDLAINNKFTCNYSKSNWHGWYLANNTIQFPNQGTSNNPSDNMWRFTRGLDAKVFDLRQGNVPILYDWHYRDLGNFGPEFSPIPFTSLNLNLMPNLSPPPFACNIDTVPNIDEPTLEGMALMAGGISGFNTNTNISNLHNEAEASIATLLYHNIEQALQQQTVQQPYLGFYYTNLQGNYGKLMLAYNALIGNEPEQFIPLIALVNPVSLQEELLVTALHGLHQKITLGGLATLDSLLHTNLLGMAYLPTALVGIAPIIARDVLELPLMVDDLQSAQIALPNMEQWNDGAALTNEKSNAFYVFPNPTTGNELFLALNQGEIKKLFITDLQGKQLSQPKIITNAGTQVSINIDHLPAGAYLISVVDSNGAIYRNKFIKTN